MRGLTTGKRESCWQKSSTGSVTWESSEMKDAPHPSGSGDLRESIERSASKPGRGQAIAGGGPIGERRANGAGKRNEEARN
jgi:hypothetical protein